MAYSELGRAGRGGAPDAARPAAPGTFEVEDFASALLRLDNGRSLHLETSWAGYTADEDDIGGRAARRSAGGVRLFVENYATDGTIRSTRTSTAHRRDSRPRDHDTERGHGSP